ncbi:hypothetical protein C8R43DRAFT_153626 [Mycena crocata]|nr:hypothetical protein C8R43DRAFT_153626 [Mycena crocata]
MFPFCTTCSPLASIQALSLPASTLLPQCLQIPSTLIRIPYPSARPCPSPRPVSFHAGNYDQDFWSSTVNSSASARNPLNSPQTCFSSSKTHKSILALLSLAPRLNHCSHNELMPALPQRQTLLRSISASPFHNLLTTSLMLPLNVFRESDEQPGKSA